MSINPNHMFSVTVKDHIMVAHSLPDPFFGPAQGMHGATFHVDAIFSRKELTDKNVVIDIGEAIDILSSTLKHLAYQNLDVLEEFEGVLTTTEFLAKHIHTKIKSQIHSEISLKIVLHESNQASASYEA